MTLPRLAQLRKHWAEQPPTRWLLATFVGYKGRSRKTTKPGGSVMGLVGMAGVGLVRGGAKDLMPLFEGVAQEKK